jgi:nitronate monooxygenase
MLTNKLTKILNIEFPIIQAPMAGGVTKSELVAAVSNFGGLGMIGAGYLNPKQLLEQVKEIKQLTQKQFGVNLFVPNEFQVSEEEIIAAKNVLEPINKYLNIGESNLNVPDSKQFIETYQEQIKIVISEKIPICSFTFGVPSKDVIEELKRNNIIVIGTATTVNEAIEIENLGMDMVVVQGSEAGGHRGNFMGNDQGSLIGLMSLIPQVVDHVTIPVIGAGGIMDGRGLIASLCLGAKGVQMGTAFLTCLESGASMIHKEAIVDSDEDQLVLTRSFSGKWARGIKNQFIIETEKYEGQFPQYPVQNTLTQGIRKASVSSGNREFMSLWSGQSPRLAKIQSVEALMKKIVNEANSIKETI